mmetsp:Transcript_2204/g.7897  ORF Transcript_2204/g.7897 Transcript_2204/m.7897 type:complete len:94 (+) Transcript_2204:572-853(+)
MSIPPHDDVVGGGDEVLLQAEAERSCAATFPPRPPSPPLHSLFASNSGARCAATASDPCDAALDGQQRGGRLRALSYSLANRMRCASARACVI